MIATNEQIKEKGFSTNYVNPEQYNFVFIIENFKDKRKNQEFVFTEIVTTKEGLQLRLKIYPKGVQEIE